jgi:hypothetical protein
MNLDNQTIAEWNELGFYYEYDNSFKQWRFFGSKKGIYKFSDLIKSYSSKLSNDAISEHIHLGPYYYLKIMTWNEPMVSKNSIAGSLSDLARLSKLISDRTSSTEIGNIFIISTDYSITSTATMLFVIMSDSFIPASIEFK